MQDLRFQQRWLVVDVVTDADLAEWEGVHQVCDSERAVTYMRVGKNRYRWEFRLAAGETADDYRDMARLHPLISPWTKSIPAPTATTPASRAAATAPPAAPAPACTPRPPTTPC